MTDTPEEKACHELATQIKDTITAHQRGRYGVDQEGRVNVDMSEAISALCAILGTCLKHEPADEREACYVAVLTELARYAGIDAQVLKVPQSVSESRVRH